MLKALRTQVCSIALSLKIHIYKHFGITKGKKAHKAIIKCQNLIFKKLFIIFIILPFNIKTLDPISGLRLLAVTLTGEGKQTQRKRSVQS